MTIIITVNGERQSAGLGITLEELLIQKGFLDKKIAVELNEEIIPRRLYSVTTLGECDSLEIVQAIGGG